MSTPDMKSPLTGCTTIDSTTPDPYLENARTGNPRAKANATTNQAASNLLNCEKQQKAPGPANLVGHGCEGDIDTGKAAGQCIRFDNDSDWKTDMATLAGTVQELFLFGCTVGAGQEGAKLLFDLAKTVNAPVSAPTGLIYCTPQGDFYLHSGAVWQTATPSKQPAPINPPTQTQTGSSMGKAELHVPGAKGPAKIVSAVYTPYGKGSFTVELSMDLAAEVVWDQPFTTDDEPGAKITGHIQITAEIEDVVIKRSLHVLAHHVLKDGNNYYPVTPRFRELLGKK
ncbi:MULTISPECIES: DUF4347 domain-containing protein [unclassified Caulobacter]|uniref:DUF4347 domain-containing protein n=1 Tax=unclassified Caulobacter TaxID=2648921 RepID=UPI000700BA66|nr:MULTISPECIES: DUF4347 domain-containing protein [unclassified Caulobacter]KQV56606.1 hypothetical protein ASC62_09765 [Caulobacter sp. Root342]KQV72243.1 hypothetical protein ASC70_00715 [Caulobacter sp. Root343]